MSSDLLTGAALILAPVAAVGTALGGGLGPIKQYDNEKKTAEEQYRIDQENIRLYNLEVDETVRRTKLNQAETEGQISANIGASGFAKGSSLDKYLEFVSTENKKDIDWMRTSGASQTAIKSREADARRRNANAVAEGNLVSGIGSAITGNVSKAFGWGF